MHVGLHQSLLNRPGITRVASSSSNHASGRHGSTSGAFNSTGANLIIAAIGRYTGGSGFAVSDSASNTYTALTAATGDGNPIGTLYYCLSPTTSATHTVTVSGTDVYTGFEVAAFGNVGAYHSNTAAAATQPGTVTPPSIGSLIVAGFIGEGTGALPTIDSGFTISSGSVGVSGQSYASQLAYLIQSVAAGVATDRITPITGVGAVRRIRVAYNGSLLNCYTMDASAIPTSRGGNVNFSHENSETAILAEYAAATALSVNPAAHTAVDVNSIYVGPGYTLNIAGTGSHFDISADKVHYQGSVGKLWLKDGAGTTDRVVVDSTDSNPLSHDCVSLAGATFTRLLVLRGMCTIEASCTVTNILVGSRTPGVIESKLVINTSAGAPTTAQQWSGVVSSNANPTTLTMFGGTWTQEQGGAVITNIIMYGGRLNLNHGGTYADVQHYGGIIDCTQKGGLKTFTNYQRSPGAVLLGEGNAGVVSLPAVTSPPNMVYIV